MARKRTRLNKRIKKLASLPADILAWVIDFVEGK